MSIVSTKVVCSICGKILRGRDTPVGYSVRPHRPGSSLDDRPEWAQPNCPGFDKLDHQPVKKGA